MHPPEKPPQSPSQASAGLTFELHSLGWKGFQDLCLTIVRELLGQSVQEFSASNDGGRDGAFYGTWKSSGSESFSGSLTIQCKFSVNRDEQLRLSGLAADLEKAKRLAQEGLASTYILMTNHRLTGENEEKIRREFLSVDGLNHFAIYGDEWIASKIRESPRLRMLVPRVYGLGDLSQILDERALAQASAILSSLGDDISKFVITEAHRQSAKSLVKEGFVLLLGEPASGKSTIAAALAVAALDNWKCTTIKIR